MHPDTFHHLHHARSADLRREATAHRRAAEAQHPGVPDHRDVRAQLGWLMVELGLRLVRTADDTRFRTARVS